ncbi:hypothetical protein KUCAC02_019701 [Chaenocephalus aceratus]|uniref:Uncharacterized protein n=1 Tax=Chaenocephalus aceratus TaxID=36190 RepID=A0ACB9VP51_CHAAC|nr:hypothetical protein KUCAC02_019701 [Chaenocephalus aceratus]
MFLFQCVKPSLQVTWCRSEEGNRQRVSTLKR